MEKVDKKDLKVLSDEIHFRNILASFKTYNLKERKVAVIPELAVFWGNIKPLKLYYDAVSLRDAENYGEFKIHGGGHFELWNKICPQNPNWELSEYEDIPRGRVNFHVPSKIFTVSMCPKLNKPAIKNLIINTFNLPTENVKFDFNDEHYVVE